jgi:hypothetical protein
MGNRLELKSPTTFNEKLQWLKIHDRKPEYTAMVDKYEVKRLVAEKIGEQYIIKTLGIWNSFDEIVFSKLPERFVLKCTHDSGGLVICRNKSTLEKAKVKEKIGRSMAQNYYWASREWPYKDVKPRIIAEEYMEDGVASSGLTDYKFFCFNNEAKMLYVSQGLENHTTAKISFYDLDGREMPFHRSDYRPVGAEMTLPDNYPEMLEKANVLAKCVNSPFVRIDLYSVEGKIYFSEITFSPCSGMISFAPTEWDKKLGEWIVLPSEK